VTMAKGTTVRGRILLEGASAQDGVTPTQVVAVSTIQRSPGPGVLAPVSVDGTFELRDVHDMNVFRVVEAPSGWHLKAVTLRGADITDKPVQLAPGEQTDGLEIHLTKQQPRLKVTVTGRSARAASDAILVVFSTDPSQWGARSRFVKSGRFDGAGKCEVEGLPPGSYFVAMVDDVEQPTATDPEFLGRIKSQATVITLREGDTQQVLLARRATP